jgi:hypothetical protein
MPNQRNQFDTKDCLEVGERAETQFARIAVSRGWKVTTATSRQDIDEHWDVLIEKDGERHRVDVKAMKRINRRDAQPQDEWVWIELRGVREGEHGWLFGGQGDWIAFERTKSFALVERKALAALILKLVDPKAIVASPELARYKVYQRPHRPDKLTLIENTQLDKIRIVDWEKLEATNKVLLQSERK